MRSSRLLFASVAFILAVTMVVSPVNAAKPNPGPDVISRMCLITRLNDGLVYDIANVEPGWGSPVQPLYVWGGLKNIGSSAGTWTVTITCNGTQIGDSFPVTLGSQEEYYWDDRSWTVPTTTPASTYILCVNAEPRGSTQETNTANNGYSDKVTVTSGLTHIDVMEIQTPVIVKKSRSLWEVTIKVKVVDVSSDEPVAGVHISSEMLRVPPGGNAMVGGDTGEDGSVSLVFTRMYAGEYTFRIWSIHKDGCIDYPWTRQLRSLSGIVLK
jgi:hypothetical protein